ncbi:2Fe-2S iron-sulfur cluster-binding protein [Streptomyces sp. NPDC007904]|uniref:2Fe-2S iron-sulfur cluster-binding protein n=1 Tax=Streptomyces sp. NPDC007904 TaxID=3364787 RepID=UPI0036EAB42E
MTDDQHGEGTPHGGGRWDPLPQGDYDDGATAFVKLPEGGVDALLDAMESPLAAPGHGYVPPQITVAPATTAGTDPAATGAWPAPGAPVDGAQWHDPQAAQTQPGHPGAGAAPGHVGQDRFPYDPGATGQWATEETPGPQGSAPGHDVTGQWSIPVAGGDLPDESGEFTTSALVEQWGGTPPATLPGGAPAPWATQAIGQPWGPGVPGVPQEGQGAEHAADAFGAEAPEAGPAHHHAGTDAPEREGGPRSHGGPGQDDAPAPGQRSETGPERYGEQAVQATQAVEAVHAAQAAQDVQAAPGAHAHAVPGQPLAGHGAERPGAADHAPGGPGAAGPQEASGMPGHAPGQPAHAGHRSSGVPQPYPAEAYQGSAEEPRWPSDAQAYADPGAPVADGASAELREHPRPDAQDAPSRPGPGAGETPGPDGPAEDAPGAPGVAEGPAEHSAAPARTAPDTDADAGAEPADGGGAPSPDADTPDAADDADTDDDPGAPDAPGISGTPDDRDAPGAEGGTSASADPAPDAAPAPHDPPPGAPHDDHPLASYVLRVNGTDRPVTDAWIGESLLYVLRERLGLAGAKDGCSQGECGACNVQVDGRLVASCLVPAVTAAGSEVRTVEGLAQDGQPSDVQRALARCGAVQCGFCVPGMAMTVHDLLEGNPAPTELETRQALCGNLCRCSGYRGVVDAVQEVVAEREAHAASPEPEPDGDTEPPRIPHQAGPGAGGVNLSAFGTPGPHDQPYGQDGGQA